MDDAVSNITFRNSTESDLPRVVALLADDALGSRRETASTAVPEPYMAAHRAIADDRNHQVLVAEVDGELAGFLQLSFLPHLTYTGGWRAQIEGVRVAAAMRSRGIGRALIAEAVARARAHGCHLVQLTTDKRRPEAIRFYVELGFVASHEGMKLHLDPAAG